MSFLNVKQDAQDAAGAVKPLEQQALDALAADEKTVLDASEKLMEEAINSVANLVPALEAALTRVLVGRKITITIE